MFERYHMARQSFAYRMSQGMRPEIYCALRLHGGEYVSPFTEQAWKEFLAGWLAAGGRED